MNLLFLVAAALLAAPPDARSTAAARHAAPAAIPSGPGIDSAPAIQAAVDAAQAVTDANGQTGRTVRLPETPFGYGVMGPVYVDGRNITIEGDGLGSNVHGVNRYGGPPFVTGISRLERLKIDPARFRPRSVLGGGRRAVATRGEAVLVATAHPIQLGGGENTNIVPDYWQSAAYCWEFVIARPSTWGGSVGLFGFPDDNGSPSPWSWRAGGNPGTLELWFRTSEQTGTIFRKAAFPTPGPGPWRVTAQWDGETGSVSVWVNGSAQPVTLSSVDKTPFAPGARLSRHDGAVPFTVGAGGPLGTGVTDLTLHALAVTRGRKYKGGTRTETRTDGRPVDDGRYLEMLYGAVQTVALLPMDDPPQTHVAISAATARGVGFWLPAKLGPTSSRVAFRRLKLTPTLQQALAVGYLFDLDLIDLDAGGRALQGIGSVPIACTYPVTMERCRIGGLDAAYYGYMQLLHANNTTVNQTGRDGVRCNGGSWLWENSTFTFSLDSTDTYFRSMSQGYGGGFEVHRAMIDNELGGPRVAVVDVDHSPNCPNVLKLDGVGVSKLDAPVFVRVRGRRTAATGNTYAVGKLDIKNLGNFNGGTKTAVRIDGRGWYGVFDPNGLDSAAVAGDVGDLKVIPLVVPSSAP